MMRRILIVDDSAMNRSMLQEILRGQYALSEARDGKEAMAILDADPGIFSAVLLDIIMPHMDGFEVLTLMRSDERLARIPVLVTTSKTEPEAEIKALSLGANDFISKPYHAQILLHRLKNAINLSETIAVVRASRHDELTGLLKRKPFFAKATQMIAAQAPNYYVLDSFDINNFKVINDQYGADKGDDVLRSVAQVFREGLHPLGGIICRVTADNFALLYPRSFIGSAQLEKVLNDVTVLDGSMLPITYTVGRYLVEDASLPVSAMYERATLAMGSIKGLYDVHIAEYNESMRDHLLHEQRIVTDMKDALNGGQFEVWFQPQYNHAAGTLVGAEALMRWRHPREGLLIPPGKFIPVFERNGFIYEMDKHVWEQVCIHLRRWLDEGNAPLPISVNVSRYDVFREDFYEVITGLVERYRIPVDLLRLEITETAFAMATEQIITVVKRLMEYGFIVEIDDFGSGYSSLNTLKDVPATVLKLDMHFLENTGDSQRGGSILESVVRMAKWIGMSVIAEGVETKEQADFLKSIGCYFVQGYLYARPMLAEHYEKVMKACAKEPKVEMVVAVEKFDSSAFWDPKSMDTLIFNSFVGGACIFEYHNGSIELLRTTEKYAQIFGAAGLPIEDVLKLNWIDHLDEQGVEMIRNAVQKSREEREEVTNEYVFHDLPDNPGETHIRSSIRVIASTGSRNLVYCLNENITAQREAEKKQREAEQRRLEAAQRLHAIMEHVNSGIVAVSMESGKVDILFANSRYYEMLGYSRAEYEAAFGDNFLPISAKDRDWVMCSLRAFLASKEPALLEYRVDRQDGAEIWVQQRVAHTWLSGIEGMVQLSAFTDITQQKNDADVLRETDEQLRFLNETAHNLLSQNDCDQGIEDVLGRLLHYFDANRAYVFEFDFERQIANNTYEVCNVGVTSEKANLQDVPFEVMSLWIQAFGQRRSINIEDVNQLDESRALERDILLAQGISSLIAVPLRRDDQLIGCLGIDDPHRLQSHVDRLDAIGDYTAVMITRRDLNAKIERDNNMLKSLMNDTPGGFARMRVNANGAIVPVYFNDGYCEMLGMTHDMLLSRNRDDAFAGIHPDDVDIVKNAANKLLVKGEVRSKKFRMQHGDGSYVWLMFFGRAILSDKNELFLNIYYTNVSEREKQELSIREIKAAALATIMRFAQSISFVKDRNLTYIYCSRTLAQVVGIADESEMIGKTCHEVMGAEYADEYCAMDRRVIETGKPVFNAVARIPQPDGKTYYTNATKYPLIDTAGNIIGVYGVIQNTTIDRETYEHLKLMTDSIPGGLGSYACSPDDIQLLYFNDGFSRLFGFDRKEFAELVSQNPLSQIFPEDIPVLQEQIRMLRQEGTPIDHTYRIHTKTGAVKWMSLRAVAVEKYEDVVIANAVIVDITALKETQERLRVTEEEIKVAFSQMGKMMCVFDVETHMLTTPEVYARKHGLPEVYPIDPEVMRASPDFDEDGSKAILKFYNSVLNGEDHAKVEVHCRCADDSWCYEQYEAVIIRDLDGKPVKAVISIEDVTLRHEMGIEYEMLRKNEHIFKSVATHSNRAVYCYAIAERVIYPILAGAEMPKPIQIDLDRPDPDIAGGTVLPESVADYRKLFEDMERGSLAGIATIHAISADGMAMWLEIRYSRVQSEDGMPQTAVITIKDITEDREKELAYERYRQTIDQHAIAEGVLIFLEVDVTMDIVEKHGGIMMPDAFMFAGDSIANTIQFLTMEFMVAEERERSREYFSREHLITLFSDGVRSTNEDWQIKFRDGNIGFVRSEMQMVLDPYSKHIKAYIILRDITEIKQKQLAFKAQAERDGLTELYNKTTLETLIRQRLARNDGAPCTLLIADIDDLKIINDTLGHPHGDRSIRAFAQILRTQFRNTDIMGRIGGDEFLVFMEGVAGEDKLAAPMEALMKRIGVQSLEEHDAGSDALRVTIGIAFGVTGACTFEELYEKADQALYRAKRSGKNQYAFYSQSDA